MQQQLDPVCMGERQLHVVLQCARGLSLVRRGSALPLVSVAGVLSADWSDACHASRTSHSIAGANTCNGALLSSIVACFSSHLALNGITRDIWIQAPPLNLPAAVIGIPNVRTIAAVGSTTASAVFSETYSGFLPITASGVFTFSFTTKTGTGYALLRQVDLDAVLNGKAVNFSMFPALVNITYTSTGGSYVVNVTLQANAAYYIQANASSTQFHSVAWGAVGQPLFALLLIICSIVICLQCGAVGVRRDPVPNQRLQPVQRVRVLRARRVLRLVRWPLPCQSLESIGVLAAGAGDRILSLLHGVPVVLGLPQQQQSEVPVVARGLLLGAAGHVCTILADQRVAVPTPLRRPKHVPDLSDIRCLSVAAVVRVELSHRPVL